MARLLIDLCLLRNKAIYMRLVATLTERSLQSFLFPFALFTTVVLIVASVRASLTAIIGIRSELTGTTIRSEIARGALTLHRVCVDRHGLIILFVSCCGPIVTHCVVLTVKLSLQSLVSLHSIPFRLFVAAYNQACDTIRCIILTNVRLNLFFCC